MDKQVYVASSWRNQLHPQVVIALQDKGYKVYDFKNPEPGNHGFHWSEIDPKWKEWTPKEFIRALYHPIAIDGFNRDMNALANCDICVLVLPCGRSAHLELGHAVGAGKYTFILNTNPEEPELMYRMVNAVCTSIEELLDVIELQVGAEQSWQKQSHWGW